MHVHFSLYFAQFILGLSLGPLSPSLFCWLDRQDLSNRLSLSLLCAVGIAVRRRILSPIIAFFVYICSKTVLLFAVLYFIFLTLHFIDHKCHTTRIMIRLSATNQFSSGRSAEVSVRTHG